MDHPVVVVGGGIGGLTAAFTLVHRSIPCLVCEQTPELREIGAGLGLWPAPLQVFDKLGIGDQVRALSSPWETAGLRSSDGRVLVGYTAAEFAACFGEPTIGVHRGELQVLLLRSLPEGVVNTGRRCVNVQPSSNRTVVVTFEDGSSVRARAVIGADGQRSRIRALLFGDRSLHDCRCVGWRGTTIQPRGSDWHTFAGETWGPGGRFGMIPISDDRVTWYAAARAFRSDGGTTELLERFGHWHHPIPALLHATPDDNIWRDHIYDRWPLRRWSLDRMTLLGDAAHPMTPNSAKAPAKRSSTPGRSVTRSLQTQTSRKRSGPTNANAGPRCESSPWSPDSPPPPETSTANSFAEHASNPSHSCPHPFSSGRSDSSPRAAA